MKIKCHDREIFSALLAQCQGNTTSGFPLNHWGRVTHMCVSKLTIIGSDNGLSPAQEQPIIWTIDLNLLIRP